METISVIYELVSDGDLQGLKMCLAQHTKDEVKLMVTATDDDRRTPLTLACQRGHVDIAEYLIDECGADTEQCGWVEDDAFPVKEASPVWWAVAKGHLNIVRLLLIRGATMNGDAMPSWPSFIVACENGDLQMVKYLLANGADIEVADEDGANGLMAACYAGHCAVASYLIRNGFDVNFRNENGNTALIFAMLGERLKCMALLIRYGAESDDIWSRFKPLLMIRGTEDPHMVEYVINLPFSTRSAKIEALESLGAKCVNIEDIQQGGLTNGRSPSDVDAVDSELDVDNIVCGHKTTLVDMEQLDSEAEETRDVILIRKPVVDCQMSVDTCYAIDCCGQMVNGNICDFWLHAVEMRRKSVMPLSQLTKECLPRIGFMLSYMVAHDEPVEFEVIMAVFVVAVHEIETEMRRTMAERIYDNLDELFSMIMHVMVSIFKVSPTLSATQVQLFHQIVHKLVDLNPRDSRGWTLLHLACCGNVFPFMFEAVKSLLEHGADPVAISDHRDSPLHVLATCRPVKYDLIKLLLSHGAHFDARNSDGNSFNDILPESEKFIPFEYVTLKCLAAASVVNNLIPYESHVPRRLADFIKLH